MARLGGFAFPGIPSVYLTNTQPLGTGGNTYTTGAFRTIVLNTENSDPSNLCTLAANQVTLLAGTYFINAWFNVQAGVSNVSYKTRLRNITDGTTPVIGATVFQSSNQSADANPCLFGVFQITDTKVLELQAQFSVTTTAITAANFTESEVYTQLVLMRIAN